MYEEYDYIITGAGCAGLSLAYHFCQDDWGRKQKILLLDQSKKDKNDRTWCYWSKQKPTYQSAKKYSWENLEFFSQEKNSVQSIAPYQYICIRGIDFYEELSHIISKHTPIDWRTEKVISIQNQGQGGEVTTSQGTYRAKMIFNSIPFQTKFYQKPGLHTRQHFYGFFIKTQKDSFDPQNIRLMDFRVQANQDVRFFYILPFSPREALVEFTVLSDTLLKVEEYQQQIKTYIHQQLNIEEFSITAHESGMIPMSDYAFPRQEGDNILHIGTIGGMTKSTTGYTFKNIQRDSQLIVQSLGKGQLQYLHPQKAQRFRFYDRLLLYLMKHEPKTIEPIMRALFLRNDHRQVLKFLDEQTLLHEEAAIFLRLPWRPFLKSLYRIYIQKSIRYVLSKIWPTKLIHSPSNS